MGFGDAPQVSLDLGKQTCMEIKDEHNDTVNYLNVYVASSCDNITRSSHTFPIARGSRGDHIRQVTANILGDNGLKIFCSFKPLVNNY